MFTNADITLYSYGQDKTYTRSVVNNVFWQESKQSNIEKTGMASVDSVKIFIPVESAANGLKFTIGKDMVIKGVIEADFDNTSQATISASLTALKATYEVYTVTVADDKLYGNQSMQHYQLSCK